MRKLLTTTAILMMSVTGAFAATNITGSYSVGYVGVGHAPTITYDLNHTSFTESLTAGMTYGAMDFITLAPGNSCGTGCVHDTASGTVTVNFTLSDDGGAHTVAASDTGAYSATYTPGHQSDYITWTTAYPTPLVVDFTDGAILDIYMISTSDWDLVPTIKFKLTNGPNTQVPEPSSIALVGAGLLGLGFMVARNRRKILKKAV